MKGVEAAVADRRRHEPGRRVIPRRNATPRHCSAMASPLISKGDYKCVGLAGKRKMRLGNGWEQSVRGSSRPDPHGQGAELRELAQYRRAGFTRRYTSSKRRRDWVAADPPARPTRLPWVSHNALPRARLTT